MLGYQACTIMADGGVAKQSEETPLNSRSAKLQEDNSKWTPWLVYTTIVIVIGSSLQFGYNTSCINAPEEVNEVAHTCRQYWPWFAWNLETIKAVWSWSFNVPMILGNQVNHGRIPNPFGGGLPRTIAFQNILRNVLSSCSNVARTARFVSCRLHENCVNMSWFRLCLQSIPISPIVEAIWCRAEMFASTQAWQADIWRVFTHSARSIVRRSFHAGLPF